MYYLVTGYVTIDGKGSKDVRETANQPDEQEAVPEVERRLAEDRICEWNEGPDIEPLPTDMFMREVAGAQELPGL